MTVFQPGPKARTFNYRAGDVGYVPVGNFHYVQNIGKEKLVFLEIFKSNHFSDISLSQWIAMTPNEVVKSVLNLSDEFLNNVKKECNDRELIHVSTENDLQRNHSCLQKK